MNVVCDAVTDAVDHPLVAVLRPPPSGVFPAVDGVAELMPPDAMGTCAVVSFTGHAYVLTDLPPSALDELELDGYGAASEANALVAPGGRPCDRIARRRAGHARRRRSDVARRSATISSTTHACSAPAITGAMYACSATSAGS